MPSSSRDLKGLSLQFRTLISQAARAHSSHARVDLRRLLHFVETTPVLAAEIERAPRPEGDVLAQWEEAVGAHERMGFPDDPLEELGLLHALLTAMAQESEQPFFQLCYGYGSGQKWEDHVSAVLGDLCPRYGAHLRNVLELALLDSSDPAYDNRRVDIHVSGGHNQLNLAQDQGRIEASQSFGADAAQVLRLANELAAAARTAHRETDSEEAAELVEVAEAVVSAAQGPSPSRFTLRTAKEKLELFAGSASAISSLATHAHTLGPQALHLAVALKEWLAHLAR